jgi:hypothetical protein
MPSTPHSMRSMKMQAKLNAMGKRERKSSQKPNNGAGIRMVNAFSGLVAWPLPLVRSPDDLERKGNL